MVINTLNWILFVFLVLLFVTLYITSWVLLNDKTNKEQKGAGLSFFFCGLLSAFIFIPAIEIFNNNAAVVLWKVLAAITLLSSILVLIFSDHIQKQKSYKWSLLFIILATIIPFIIDLTISSDTTDVINFNNHYSLESLGLIGAIISILSTIVLIVFIVFTNKTRRKISELNHALLYYQNEYKNFSTFQKPYEKSLREDLFILINQLENRISSLLKIKENKSKNSDTNELTTNEIHDLNKKIDEIQKVMILLGDRLFDKKEIDFDLIRDLNHFFATPFATIEANTELLKSTKGINTTYLEKINNSIQLCKCIIETYRESLSFSNNQENVIDSLKQTIGCAYNTYAERNEKILKPLNTTNIPDRFLSHNNHYLISIILPLLENAIQAAPNNSEIEINFNNNDRTIRISNMCDALPTLINLQTQGYSSKENHRGNGLMIVKSLLSLKNRGTLTSEIDEKNNKVIQTIKLTKDE